MSIWLTYFGSNSFAIIYPRNINNVTLTFISKLPLSSLPIQPCLSKGFSNEHKRIVSRCPCLILRSLRFSIQIRYSAWNMQLEEDLFCRETRLLCVHRRSSMRQCNNNNNDQYCWQPKVRLTWSSAWHSSCRMVRCEYSPGLGGTCWSWTAYLQMRGDIFISEFSYLNLHDSE